MTSIVRLDARALDKDELKQHFNAQGCVIVENVFPQSALESACNELEALVDLKAEELLKDGHVNETYKDVPFEKRIYRLYAGKNQHAAPKLFRTELHREGLYPLFFHQPLLDCVEHLLGTCELRLYPNYTVRPKLPRDARHEVLWHQDAGYTQSTAWHAPREVSNDEIEQIARSMVNVWTPLVPATTENGCMQFVMGSHKLGIQRHVDKGDKNYLEIDDAALESALVKTAPVNVELKPGDVVLFHQLLFHCGTVNESDHEPGHMARSAKNPASAVANARQWAELELGGPNPR